VTCTSCAATFATDILPLDFGFDELNPAKASWVCPLCSSGKVVLVCKVCEGESLEEGGKPFVGDFYCSSCCPPIQEKIALTNSNSDKKKKNSISILSFLANMCDGDDDSDNSDSDNSDSDNSDSEEIETEDENEVEIEIVDDSFPPLPSPSPSPNPIPTYIQKKNRKRKFQVAACSLGSFL